jgi:hypothetical protein
MLLILDWAAARLGSLVKAPGGVGGECVDLANLWLLANGVPAVRANAADWARALAGLGWTRNGPDNFPRQGDIVVWRADVFAHGIGPFGHIAVCLVATPNKLLTVDQDWPVGAPVALTIHDYVGVAGWHSLR